MDWTKLENTFIKESRIESDIIQIKEKFALLLVTKQIAMAIVDLDTPVIPAALADMIPTPNTGEAEKIFKKQQDIERPFYLSSSYMSYHPGAGSGINCREFLLLSGKREDGSDERLFFIRKDLYDLIPGEVTVLVAPEGAKSIMYISTESYGYIMPYIPENDEKRRVMEMTDKLRKMY